MITVSNVSVNFSGQPLFKDVDLKFTPGNCYGIIGANGAGKIDVPAQSFPGDLEPDHRSCVSSRFGRADVRAEAGPLRFRGVYGARHRSSWAISRLYDVMKEKDAIYYAKEDFTRRRRHARRGAGSRIRGAGRLGSRVRCEPSDPGSGPYPQDILYAHDVELCTAKEKVKDSAGAGTVRQTPEIILLDEPTNHLDIQAIAWLEDFLAGVRRVLVMVVSHDRHFLNTVCTNIVDVDYGKITMYVGNYEFWYRVQPAGAAA